MPEQKMSLIRRRKQPLSIYESDWNGNGNFWRFNITDFVNTLSPQVVAFQAAMDIMAQNFPGAFAGYTLKVTESHQSSKVDTSGTAKAIVEYFQKLGVKFNVDEVSFESFSLFAGQSMYLFLSVLVWLSCIALSVTSSSFAAGLSCSSSLCI